LQNILPKGQYITNKYTCFLCLRTPLFCVFHCWLGQRLEDMPPSHSRMSNSSLFRGFDWSC
jgi:hypothetical protein